jgi:hypothetical protein
MIESYLGNEGGKAAAEQRRDELLDQIYEASQPRQHHYEIVRAQE